MAIKIFVDFDGTITTRDVGNAMFHRLGGDLTRDAIDRYHREDISARECFLREAALSGTFPPAALEAVIDEQAIDPYFKPFVGFCAAKGIELIVLSDGLDYYIDRIFARHGISGVRRFSNAVRLLPSGNDGSVRMELEFPAENPDCDRCACCKRNIMLTLWGEHDFLVYVGEGYSDRCPARYADLVFAKDLLQTYCQQENITYRMYANFRDVQEGVEKLVQKNRLRPRRRASVLRNTAFITE
jgi:2-hydroxy-3-keto-5-methylthiopentenyl-1-phosphate phosphatase